jgi:acyl carrier protein
MTAPHASVTQSEILALVCSSVVQITQSWNLDATISPETKLVEELGFSSMEFIDLLAIISTRLQRKLPYEQLLVGEAGNYREELSIQELSDFILTNYDAVRPPLGAM